MMRPLLHRGIPAAALLVAATWTLCASAQVFMGETPQYVVTGEAIVSYTGSWQQFGDHVVNTNQLAEGLQLSLSGWLYESRIVKFRTYVLALRLDEFGASRSKNYSLGYGGSLSLFSGSVLPITLSYGHGLAVGGFTLSAAAVTSNTILQGVAQLVSPALPRVEVRAQRLIEDDAVGNHDTSDQVIASSYGTSDLHRYAAVASWQADQYGSEPRITQTLASISDDVYASQDTRGSLSASLSRSNGFGGNPSDTFTAYQASAGLLSRLSARTLLRGDYGFSTVTGPDREETSNQASVGSTINLRPLPILLGEGFAGTTSRLEAPGLNRTIDAASASQGVAATSRWGAFTGNLAATGQAGYASVSDGLSGPVYGYGLNGGLQWAVPQAPIRAFAYDSQRWDRSSAGLSMESYGALLSSDISRYYPVFLLPIVSYSHLNESALFAPELPSAVGAPIPAGTGSTSSTFTDTNTFSATLTGTSPLYRTRLTFAGGYVDSWSSAVPDHLRIIFARAADAFRLGRGTFGNVSIDANHQLGQTTSLSALGSLVWAFRESSLSLSYAYMLALPVGTSNHTAAVLFTRRFDTSFLPESP